MHLHFMVRRLLPGITRLSSFWFHHTHISFWFHHTHIWIVSFLFVYTPFRPNPWFFMFAKSRLQIRLVGIPWRFRLCLTLIMPLRIGIHILPPSHLQLLLRILLLRWTHLLLTRTRRRFFVFRWSHLTWHQFIFRNLSFLLRLFLITVRISS